MSYDIHLQADTGTEWPDVVEIGNYTSNVAGMWVKALNGVRLAEFHGAPCSEAAGPLAEAVKRMESDPDAYREMNPPNGHGNYEGALGYLRRLAEACAKHPKCRIGISA
ncbi:hypothetical protein [Spongiactinospora sp. TRM90649]|uniref:hypothetical protein n=1 Tax=Spongiactinospora sp. TRM90649 TaxID=3031114 RepID=UPI0023F86E4A|nr:hypothetical protein [Spongiactinospora sp. TRM90649]MDF5758594.1 hypothetical protein [Spongiactinospora sp. TRM90649]